MKRIIAVLLLALTLLNCSFIAAADTPQGQGSIVPETTAPAEEQDTIPFTDVKEAHWFYDEVVYAYSNGIFTGVTETTFEPNSAMTRAMLVQVLYNIEGRPEFTYNGEEFKDVKDGQWFAPAVKWAVEKGVASGIGGGRFSPNGKMTREQLATMLYNYAGTPEISESDYALLDNYADVISISPWAKDAFAWAVSMGHITGLDKDTLAPRGNATRAQVARVLMLYLEKLRWSETVTIGSGRQLFVDDYIINTELGNAYINIESPVKKEAVFTFDQWHEREDTVYHNIVNMPDGSYRMYYKATSDIRRICYIESEDGLNWTRPNLNYGTNIVTPESCSPDNLFVFYDNNPACPENRRLKGVYGQWGDGLFLEYTNNGGDFFEFWPNEQKMMGKPYETGGCFFDTLNTVYWDESRGQYVAFVRGFHTADGNYNLSAEYVSGEETAKNCHRDIRVAFSYDCVNWTTPVPLKYNTTDDYQLYTNAVIPYYRSEGLYVGMPTRFFQSVSANYTQIFFMSSRDLYNWNRTEKPYLKPENGTSFRYEYSGYPCIGFIETAPGEMSFYMKEYVRSEGCTVLYRYTLRVDGFMSAMGDTLVTKPLSYEGNCIKVNSTGDIKVTLTDTSGNRSTAYLTGDNLDTVLQIDLAPHEGKEVILTFEMSEGAKLYSFKFD